MNTLKRYMKVTALSVLITGLCLSLLAIFAGFTLNRILVYLDTCEFQGKIKNEQVSFVVQGPIRGNKDSTYKGSTQACLKSIRRHFSGSAVILSTWEGRDVNGLDYDKLVLSKEPQGFLYSNIKQHVSTLEGLKLVTTEYALKIRSDAYLGHRGFVNYYAKYGIKSGGKHNVFDLGFSFR